MSSFRRTLGRQLIIMALKKKGYKVKTLKNLKNHKITNGGKDDKF